MNERKNSEASRNLDDLSLGPVSPINPFELEDLVWEHFEVDDKNLTVVCNRSSDPLIPAAANLFDSFQGKKVLELGPYEGFHTINLEKLGATNIASIEGNPRNFLKCCVVQNHYQLSHSNFLLGNCEIYLDNCEEKFDLVVASGILYHLFDPIRALENIFRITDKIAICSVYYHPTMQHFAFTGKTKPIDSAGLREKVIYERHNPDLSKGFKHGMEKTAWMFDLDTLYKMLEINNFSIDIVDHISGDEPSGPRIRLLAHR